MERIFYLYVLLVGDALETGVAGTRPFQRK